MDGLRRLWAAFDDRVGVSTVFMPIIKHPVPPTTGAISWAYVFGSATLVSFLVAVITGIPLAAEYIPSSGQAYESILWINTRAIFGYQIRALHYFSANLMLVMIAIHMFRVFLMGSYKYPREANWIAGVLLLFLTVGITFTGQILRWDQVGVYTVMITVFQAVRTPIIGNWIGDFLLGGNTVTGVTVSRFYALHVFVLPGLLFAIIGFHLYMVIHAGISEPPKNGRPVDRKGYRAWYHQMLKRDGVPFWPDAAWRDVTFGIGVLIVICILAITVGAPPLAGPPNPADINVVPRPDWYYLWYFAALAIIPSSMENVVMIVAPLGLIVGMLLLPIWANKGERSPARRPWAMIVVLCSGLMVFSLTLTGALAGWSPRFDAAPLPTKVIGATSGPVHSGAMLFHTAGCEDCHSVGGYGGLRGPDLTNVGNRLTSADMIIRIMNGGDNMPSFARILSPTELSDLVAFLQSRTVYNKFGLGGQARPAATPPPGKGAQRWIAWDAAKHTATLTLIAGYNNAIAGFNFNGFGKGEMVISVPQGYHVTVKFSNQGTLPHSALFTPNADKNLTTNFPLAFPGAASTDPTGGIAKGQTDQFSFVASKPGTYALVCAVPGHAAAGMWDVFKVTSGGQPSVVTPGHK
jgi:ubiquinol-cytochrome c reductase cytochrome b subunit